MTLVHTQTTRLQTEQTEKNPILVLGGNGKTGRRVAERLAQLNWPLRIGSRQEQPAFDWENPATWQPALRGIHAVYITFQPDLAVPGAPETIRAFVEAAVSCGVRKLVLLSGRGEPEARQCEQVVINAGLDWTILRASWFCQNFSESYLLESVLAGHVALPIGNVREPFVDADDIADVAVAALTQPGHAGQVYELTGPDLLTFGEAIAEIARAVGRPIQYQSIPVEQYRAELAGAGVPDAYVELLTYLFTQVLDGRNASLTNGVERALGRAPRSFRDYVRRTAATGAWLGRPGV